MMTLVRRFNAVRVARGSALALFLVSLLLTALQTEWTDDETVSQAEKRALAAFPGWPWSRSPARRGARRGGWARKMDAFLEDRLGLRDVSIRTYGTVSFDVWNRSLGRKVLKGEAGWLFYHPRHPLARITDLEDVRMALAPPGPRDLGIMTGLTKLASGQEHGLTPVREHFYSSDADVPRVAMYHDSFGVAVRTIME